MEPEAVADVIDGVAVPDSMTITATNDELLLEVEILASLQGGRMVAREVRVRSEGREPSRPS